MLTHKGILGSLGRVRGAMGFGKTAQSASLSLTLEHAIVGSS